MMQDLIFCLQEATVQLLSKKYYPPTDPSECFVNPPCECNNPGKNLQCEDCPYLEACLSSFKTGK
ncbi:hypothetical protein A6770_15800 [Nostoc minutum NIES-26]|uniref:Uncharacterized protein n=1 Tax=Nostoc minutum NIES-26 TaxID=1844469 RepID=A0A367RIV1_9NOSO|nr:hypothetical protein A6770_15800 [Nostoc minutum NIES-26]